MLENLVSGKRVVKIHYHLSYVWECDPNAGFSFDCDEFGIIPEGYFVDRPLSLENYQNCVRGYDERGWTILFQGVKTWETRYWDPAHGTCRCGREVYLEDTLYNSCDCGVAYSGTGQELAPVSQWEPEDVYDTFGPRDYDDGWFDR